MTRSTTHQPPEQHEIPYHSWHDIEHIWLDKEGFVYWKTIQVEHYALDWINTVAAHTEAADLAQRCALLETIGKEVSTLNALWRYQEICQSL